MGSKNVCNMTQAKTYKNKALAALFMMNNVHYMVKAVESSPALAIIGEEWIEQHRDQASNPTLVVHFLYCNRTYFNKRYCNTSCFVFITVM